MVTEATVRKAGRGTALQRTKETLPKDPNARFRYRAERLAGEANDAIRRMQHLAGPDYKYSPEEADFLCNAMVANIESLRKTLKVKSPAAGMFSWEDLEAGAGRKPKAGSG